MQGPFIVGVSFASEDIGDLLSARKELGITANMLTNPPSKGDASYRMCKSHGDKWCAWQVVMFVYTLEEVEVKFTYLILLGGLAGWAGGPGGGA